MKELFEIIGVSGYERNIREYIRQQLPTGDDRITYVDNVGNLVHIKYGTQPSKRIMVMAHMDEVGFQVMKVEGDGTALFKPLGNIKAWNAINERIVSSNHEVSGVIINDSAESVNAHDYDKIKGIPLEGMFQIGDVFGFDAHLTETKSKLSGKAIDNRISCANMLKIIQSKEQYTNDVYFVFSVQEEIGMRGSRVAITTLEPDIIIDLDVSPVGKLNSLEMGAGVGIKISDSIVVSDQDLVKQCEKLARENNVVYQREVSDCGTTELIITNEKDNGAKRIGFSIPCLNMHTSKTIVNKKDVEMEMMLLKLLLENV